MGKINWLEKLGWSEEHIEDLKYTGYSYVKQGKYDIALPFFHALIVLEPAEVYNFQTLGAIYIQLNQYQEAVKFLQQALKFEGNHGSTLLNLSKAFFSLEQKNEALKILHVLKKDKNDSIANMAKALLMAHS